jgi:hypothetical protein
VEAEAGALEFLLTNRNDEFGWGFPDVEIHGPNGEYFPPNSGVFSGDEFYRLAKVAQPAEGTWRIRLTGNGPPLNDNTDAPQKNYLLAHIANEGPDCRVWASRNTADDDTESVDIHAEAAFDGAIGAGVTYTGYVKRPNGTQVDLEMRRSDGGGAIGVFDGFVGRGYYEAVVKCVVSETALYAPGEQETFQEFGQRGRPPAFTREPSTWLFLDSQSFWDHGGDDCDDDGLPDIEEGSGDLDGDGVPDECDDDTDGDDITDADDGGGPGSTNPGGGDGGGDGSGGGDTFVPPDTDGDGVPDFRDTDSDNDGDPDGLDPDPLDPAIHRPDQAVCGTSLDGLFQVMAQLERGHYEGALTRLRSSIAAEEMLTAGWPAWSWRRVFLDVALYWEAAAEWAIESYQPGGQYEGEEVFLGKAQVALQLATLFKAFGCAEC